MRYKKRKTKKETAKKRAVLTVTLVVLIMLLSLVAIGTTYVTVVIKQLPSVTQLSNRTVSQSTKIFDRTSKVLLYEIHGEEKRTVIPFEEIPGALKWATLTAEDANFYNQPAFSWKAIVRAFLVNLKRGRIVQGGSTITQQLAKNTFLNREKTFARKIKELILAIELESRYSKDEILWLYLNQVAYGSNAYGVEAASQTYFAKPARHLSLAESATLAVLPKAPSYYSPWGNHKEELLTQKDYLLDRMARLGYISEKELGGGKKAKIVFAPQMVGSIKAPHFSLAVKDYLVEKYGEELVTRGGLKVITTLDWDMQKIAEKVVREGSARNEDLYGGKNAALVSADPKTGQVLTLVGSRDYFDVKNDGNFNVATQGLRQPGSALKPFVYLTAFMQGYAPKTMVFDVPTEFAIHLNCPNEPVFSNKNKDCFHPQNFDEKFRGPVSFEEALAQSINLPSVKVLYLANPDKVLELLPKFGITTLREKGRYGLSLVLGGGEVRLIELTNAYAVLANEGIRREPALILKIEDQTGQAIEEYHDEPTRVTNPQYPRLINQILSDKQLRAGLFQNSLSLTVFPEHEVALKTGTTNDYRDAWAIGYTPALVVGVWAGNNDNTPMHREGSSILAAVPIWSAFLKEVIAEYPPETFTKPEPQPFTMKPMLGGQFVVTPTTNNKSYPQIHSILYYVDRGDPLGPVPENPYQDSQFHNWEQAVLSWAKTNIPNFTEYNLPVAGHLFQNQTLPHPGEVIILNTKPENGATVNSPFTVKAEVGAAEELKIVELHFNRELVETVSATGGFYKLEYVVNKPLQPQNLIEIKVITKSGKQSSRKLIVFH